MVNSLCPEPALPACGSERPACPLTGFHVWEEGAGDGGVTLDTFKPFPQGGNVIFINMLFVHTQQDPVLNPGCTSESLRELENILTVWYAALVEEFLKAPR